MVKKVGILTVSEKDSLVGQTYMVDSYFYPIQDINDDWVISEQEITQNVNPAFPWVNDLPLVTYEPKT